MASLTRSVRVDGNQLKVADQSFAAHNTSFSELVRELVAYVARTGDVPSFSASADSSELPASLVEFERMVDELPATDVYATKSDDELVTDALMERYGYV